MTASSKSEVGVDVELVVIDSGEEVNGRDSAVVFWEGEGVEGTSLLRYA